MRRPAVTLGLAALVVGAFYLSAYPIGGHRAPLGFDTSRYVWRNACLGELGIRGLQTCAPPLATSMPARVGEPLTTLPPSSLLGLDPQDAVAGLPVALAAALGLAAGALVSVALGRGPGTVAITAVVVGISPFVVRLAAPEGYADNLLALGLGTGAMAVAVAGAPAAAGLLLGAAGVSHWQTFALCGTVMAGAALLSLGDAMAARRAGRALRSTVAARLAAATVGGAAVWAVASVLVIRAGPDRFFADAASSQAKVAADAASYLLPVTLGLAVVGALALARAERGALEPLLVSWIGVVGLAVVAWMVSPSLVELPLVGAGFPLHRFLAMALPVPILAALAFDRAGSLVRPRAVALIVLAATLAGWGWIGGRRWFPQEPFGSPARVEEAGRTEAYLDRSTTIGRPVIFVVDGVGPNPFTDLYQVADNVRAGLDPRRVAHTYLFLGRTEDLLAGHPTLTGDPGYDAASTFRWRPLERVLRGPHVVMVLNSLTPEFRDLGREAPERIAGPGVIALVGPRPVQAGHSSLRPGAPLGLGPAGAFLGLMAMWSLAGAGWVAALRGASLPARMALAPVAGAGAVIIAGLAASLLGVRPSGLGATAILVVASGTGVAVARWRYGRDPAGREST
ncbi:MAG TPA: hypothetical protein VGB28_02170 [Actinomycetota bacterium]